MERLWRCSLIHRLALREGPLRRWRRQNYMRYIERGFHDPGERYKELPGGTIGEVLSMDSFERLWTFQEAVLPDSGQVALYCGSKRVSM